MRFVIGDYYVCDDQAVISLLADGAVITATDQPVGACVRITLSAEDALLLGVALTEVARAQQKAQGGADA